MSEVLERFRAKWPEYRKVNDHELALQIGKAFPAYLSRPDFAEEHERAKQNRHLKRKRQEVRRQSEPSPFPLLAESARETAADVGRTLIGSFGNAAASAIESISTTAQQLETRFPTFGPETSEEMLTGRIAKAIRSGADQLRDQVDPQLREGFLTGTVPEAFGSTGFFLAGGAAARAARIPQALGIASLGAAVNGQEAFRRAKFAGADDETAYKSFLINGGIGTTEAVPLAGMLKRLDRGTGNGIKRGLIEGVEETIQESVQTVTGNAVAGALTPEDVELMAGLVESGGAGAFTGFFTSLMVTAAGRRFTQAGQLEAELDRQMTEQIPDHLNLSETDRRVVNQMRAGRDASRLPQSLRRREEQTLPETTSPERPDELFRLPPGVRALDVMPREIRIEANEMTREAVERVRLARQRTAERQEGKLPQSGALFESIGQTPGFLQTAEQRLIARTPGPPERDRIVDEPEATPQSSLEDVSQIVRRRLENRDFVGAIAELGSTKAETGRQAVDRLLGIGRDAVRLSAAERIIFNGLWENALEKSLLSAPQAESVEDSVRKANQEPGTLPDEPQQELGLEEGQEPEARAFGIDVNSGFRKWWRRYNNTSEDPPPMQLSPLEILPDFPDYQTSVAVSNQPNGLSRIRGLGWMFDPRATSQDDPVQQALINHANETARGQAITSVLGSQIQGTIDGAFEKDGSRLNVERVNPDAPLHIADFFEHYQRRPGDYRLTESQQQAVNQAMFILGKIQALQDRYKMGRRATEQEAEVAVDEVDEKAPYFPRQRIFTKEEIKEFNRQPVKGGRAVGAKGTEDKPRIFDTESEGVEQFGVTYDDSIESRLMKLAESTYRKMADKRLADNPVLGGETIKERRERFARAIPDDPERVEKLATSPGPAEVSGQALGPAFSGKIYSNEVGNKLKKVFGDQADSFRKKVGDLNAALKSIGFGIDFAAPFLQGSILMFNNPALWAKSTAKHFQAFMDPTVMLRYLENPQNLVATRELAQMGASIGNIQDFMSGLQRGGKLPDWLRNFGPIGEKGAQTLESFARAFQTFNEVALIELWKAHRSVTPRAQWPKQVETLQSMLMRGRQQEIGLSLNRVLLERMVLLAPSYLRGVASFLASANASGASGKTVRRGLGNYLLGSTVITVTGSLLAGLDWDEIGERLNPDNPDFYMVPVQFPDGRTRNIGLGGPVRSVMRLMGDISAAIIEGGEDLAELGMENPVLRWFRGKLAPVPGFVSDSWLGEDFLGNEIGPLEALRARTTPLITQQMWTRPGEPPAVMGDIAPQMLGVQVWPESIGTSYNRAREREAEARGFERFEDMPIDQQLDVSMEMSNRPEFEKPESTAGQITAAFEIDVERREKIREGLTQPLREIFDRLDLRVRGYDPTLNFGGDHKVPLTEKQRERLEELVISQYNNMLSKMPWERIERMEPSIRQDIIDDIMSDAKETARALLIREQGRSAPTRPTPGRFNIQIP